MKIRSRWLNQVGGFLAGQLLLLLYRTLRLDYRTDDPQIDPSNPDQDQFLFCLWHDSILVPVALRSRFRAWNAAALVSRHRDGGYLDEFMRQVEVRSVRGSSSQGGVQALRELMREADRCQIFITPDGPRGPERQVKDGIVFLASRTGLKIVPVATRSFNAWRIRGSWTDLIVPKPFSRSLTLAGAPIAVPPDLPRDQLEPYRLRLQAAMDELEARVQQIDGDQQSATPAARRAA